MSKVMIFLFVLITSSALVLMKLGTEAGPPIQFVDSRIQIHLTPYTVTGILLYGTSFLIYTYLISKYDLGYIIPLTTAFVYVIIFLASAVIFKEIFTAAKIAGIVLIVAGLALLNVKR